MKAVMLSIQPKWCELIASGKKTVEVRKTKPKIETPFKCYIYETQGRTETPFVDEEGHHIFKGRGQVIGEFVCNKITEFHPTMDLKQLTSIHFQMCDKSCVNMADLYNYANGKMLYGWHISDLVIYDKPKELGEFYNPEWFRDCEKQCPDMERMRCPVGDSHKADKICGWCRKGGKPITRAFQSWGYVEELKGEK